MTIIDHITIVIPVKNEELNLPRCLAALSRFKHIIIVDSQSTDSTPHIAASAGATYLNFDWNGRFPKKRNWVLREHQPATDWVLFLDADELVDDAFIDAMDAATRTGRYAGFWLNYSNYFMDKKLNHGLPQRKLALFRVGAGEYERIEEDGWSQLDMEIHEHPVIEGEIGEIDIEIDHRDYRGLARFIERHLDYAKWEARRVGLLGNLEDPQNASLTKRQKFKYKNLSAWWYPAFYFLFVYFVRLGFLDGRAGFHYAYYKMWYFHTIGQLIREARSAQASD